MFDHIGLRVADLGASIAFYGQTLAPLGLVLAIEAVCRLPAGN